jgi:serine protease inhibitor
MKTAMALAVGLAGAFLVWLFVVDKPVSPGDKPATKETNEAKDLTPDVNALVKGNNEFAFDLYARLSEKEGNIVFSPYSISSALGMTYAGARGETAAQIAKVLHFTLGQERLHPACGALIADLQADGGRPYQLDVANALWGQKGLPFVENCQQHFRDRFPRGPSVPVPHSRHANGPHFVPGARE